jgi:uncharacterized protein YkwD
MRRIPLLALAALALLRPAWAGVGVNATAASVNTSAAMRDELAAALLAETNRMRQAHGCRPLKPRQELRAAADDQAAFMSLMLAAQHTSFLPGQHNAAERVARHGLQGRMVAENVASCPLGYEGSLPPAREIAARLVAQWMDSPGHRANLLNRTFTHFGGSVRLARLLDQQWCAFGVQVFFSPQPPTLGRST